MILNHDQLNANHGECLAILRVILFTGAVTPMIMKEASRAVDEMEAHHKATREALKEAIETLEQ